MSDPDPRSGVPAPIEPGPESGPGAAYGPGSFRGSPFGPRSVRGGQVQVWGCSPRCMLLSILISIVATVLLNLLIRAFM